MGLLPIQFVRARRHIVKCTHFSGVAHVSHLSWPPLYLRSIRICAFCIDYFILVSYSYDLCTSLPLEYCHCFDSKGPIGMNSKYCAHVRRTSLLLACRMLLTPFQFTFAGFGTNSSHCCLDSDTKRKIIGYYLQKFLRQHERCSASNIYLRSCTSDLVSAHLPHAYIARAISFHLFLDLVWQLVIAITFKTQLRKEPDIIARVYQFAFHRTLWLLTCRMLLTQSPILELIACFGHQTSHPMGFHESGMTRSLCASAFPGHGHWMCYTRVVVWILNRVSNIFCVFQVLACYCDSFVHPISVLWKVHAS